MKPVKKEKRTHVSCRLPESQIRELKKLAVRWDVPLTAVLEYAVERLIENIEDKITKRGGK